MTKTILAGLVGMLLLGVAASAEAASCPAAAPAQIAFEAVPSPMSEDTSASAKEIAVKLGATESDRRAPGYYEASAATSSKRDSAVAKLPDGTVCAAAAKLTVKISLERKLWLAKELTDDQCVLQAFATAYGARAKADDEVIAEFGRTVVPTYQSRLAAIGWQSASTQDAAVQAVGDKIAPIMSEIGQKFLDARTAAQAKIDLSHLPPEPCDGATAKLGTKVGYAAK
jgi:hypothetical protein